MGTAQERETDDDSIHWLLYVSEEIPLVIHTFLQYILLCIHVYLPFLTFLDA